MGFDLFINIGKGIKFIFIIGKFDIFVLNRIKFEVVFFVLLNCYYLLKYFKVYL